MSPAKGFAFTSLRRPPRRRGPRWPSVGGCACVASGVGVPGVLRSGGRGGGGLPPPGDTRGAERRALSRTRGATPQSPPPKSTKKTVDARIWYRYHSLHHHLVPVPNDARSPLDDHRLETRHHEETAVRAWRVHDPHHGHGLARQDRHPRGAVPARRLDRSDRPHPATQAAGKVRRHLRGREQGRRHRHHRRRAGGALRARWPHPVRFLARPLCDRAAPDQGELRRAQGVRLHLRRGAGAQRAGGARRLAAQEHGRRAGLPESQPRQDDLWPPRATAAATT